jgi:hypothetical protein
MIGRYCDNTAKGCESIAAGFLELAEILLTLLNFNLAPLANADAKATNFFLSALIWARLAL